MLYAQNTIFHEYSSIYFTYFSNVFYQNQHFVLYACWLSCKIISDTMISLTKHFFLILVLSETKNVLGFATTSFIFFCAWGKMAPTSYYFSSLSESDSVFCYFVESKMQIFQQSSKKLFEKLKNYGKNNRKCYGQKCFRTKKSYQNLKMFTSRITKFIKSKIWNFYFYF